MFFFGGKDNENIQQIIGKDLTNITRYECDLKKTGKAKGLNQYSSVCTGMPIYIRFKNIRDFSDQLYEVLKEFPLIYESKSDITSSCDQSRRRQDFYL